MKSEFYIGLMSGTSLDGIDAVLVDFSSGKPVFCKAFFMPYSTSVRSELLALHQLGNNELRRSALLSNQLSDQYAVAVNHLLVESDMLPDNIVAIGCHGQTVRHCPEPAGSYSIQLTNAALLTELTGISVVTDFRSRDIAAGGQGAPLVPAFHQDVFSSVGCHRVIVNIGGIANITKLSPDRPVIGFDCGPGNLLMDAWCFRHTGNEYDKDGGWAATGTVIPALLSQLLSEPYFAAKPPKSTGRDFFNLHWLDCHLTGDESPQDVQATLLQLSVLSIANAIHDSCHDVQEIYICGGGAHNKMLMISLKKMLPGIRIAKTDELGIDADWVEGCAFAWLARQAISGLPGNLPSVTGARGLRVLGAVYRA